MNKGDKYFVIFLLIITCLGFFRGFPKPEKELIYFCGDEVVNSTYIKPVFSFLHKKSDVLTGDINEKIHRYQQLQLKTDSNKKYNVTVVEVEFNNENDKEVMYDVLKTKLVLDNGEEIQADLYKTSPFDDLFCKKHTQIGNIVFNTGYKNVKALKFPDGSVRGI